MNRFQNRLQLSLVVVLTFIICFCACSKQKTVNVQDFELSSMQGYITSNPWVENIGPIANGEEAVEKAKEIWVREFYVPWGQGNTWEEANGRPIEVYYDKSSDCWYLTGTLPKGYLGGTPKLIVQSDGEVLALWHDQ